MGMGRLSFCHRLEGPEKGKKLISQMESDKMGEYMLERGGELDNIGAKERGQSASMPYGFCHMNCNDKSREDLYFRAAPKLNTCYDDTDG